MRAAAVKDDPKLADHYGVEAPKDGVKDTATDAKAQMEAAPRDGATTSEPGDLDAEIERALNHPQIKAALESQITENHQARQQHAQGIKAAVEYAALAFADQFPDFAAIPQEQWPNAIAILQQQNPSRAQHVAAYISRANQLAAHHEHLNRETAQRTM